MQDGWRASVESFHADAAGVVHIKIVRGEAALYVNLAVDAAFRRLFFDWLDDADRGECDCLACKRTFAGPVIPADFASLRPFQNSASRRVLFAVICRDCSARCPSERDVHVLIAGRIWPNARVLGSGNIVADEGRA